MTESNAEFLAEMKARRNANRGASNPVCFWPAELDRLIALAEEREAFSKFIKCSICGGNNADDPCAYPEKHYENCMKNIIRAVVAKIGGDREQV